LEETLKLIGKLVSENFTDREIADKLNLSVSKICSLRIHELNVIYGEKRKCIICGQMKAAQCFTTKKPGYEGWCVSCRRKDGVDLYVRRNERNEPVEKNCSYGSFACIRCNRKFESPIWSVNQHFHLCSSCRDIVNAIDRVGIF
jgi:hypothetical protein